MTMKIAAIAGLMLILMQDAYATNYYSIAVVCKFDIEQYCKNISKVKIRELRECLAKQEKSLFPRCQDHYKEAR
jgi:hypothetical protein